MSNNIVFSYLMAFAANFILGASSIYWHIFESIDARNLVVYRVILSLAILGLIIRLRHPISLFIRQLNARVVVLHFVAALLVAINWGTFIWASINGTVLESGLGYLVAPVFTILFALLIVDDRIHLSRLLTVSTIIGILAILVVFSGNIEHWVYWTIGITWGGYTILKKETSLNPINGLFLETIGLAMLFLISLFVFPDITQGVALIELNYYPLLWLCGIVSVTPLVMFSYAARNLDAYSMGMLQFILPSTQLVVSILYYNQYASVLTYLCFTAIWITLLLTTISDMRSKNNASS